MARLGERFPAFAVIEPYAPCARSASNLGNFAIDGTNEWREKAVKGSQEDFPGD